MRTLLEILNSSAEYLSKKRISNPRRSAEKILSHALSLSKTDLYLQYDRPLDEIELQKIRPLLQRRASHEPVEYIFGEIDFYGISVELSKDVLIPRQETEILADLVYKELKKESSLEGKVLWDLCTGSGVLGLSLKKKIPELQVVLADISPEALNMAKKNGQRNSLQVKYCQGDFLEPFAGQKADFIVCNPPYVSAEEYKDLDEQVTKFEPKSALLGGVDGLDFYRRLADDLPKKLYPNGKVFLEIGFSQGNEVKKIFSSFSGRLEKDWSGLDRFFFLEME